MKSLRRPFGALAALIISQLFAADVVAQDLPSDLLAANGIHGGLVVHLGTSDGEMEANLASKGAWLAHGLAMNASLRDEARQTTMAKGVYGLARVAVWVDRRRPRRLCLRGAHQGRGASLEIPACVRRALHLR